MSRADPRPHAGGVSHAASTGTEPGMGRAVLVALVAMVLSLRAGWDQAIRQGLLIDTDSYTRINRILASFEAGNVLDHVPRDNGGTGIALHWSHLLDGVIVLLALPLWPLVGQAEALRLAGAALGPLGAAAAALAVMYAARRLTADPMLALAAGLMAALAPTVVGYGAVGRADHHVLLGALAVLMLALAWTDEPVGRARPAILSGVAAGLGLWLSPESLPFAVLAWALAILRDAQREGRFARRARDFSMAFLAVVAAALLIDPPPAGWLAAEIDRLSLPFVQLAASMAVVTLAAQWLPRIRSAWPAAIVAGSVALPALVPWVLMHPGIVQGAEGVFSPEAWARIWRTNTEMRSPLSDVRSIAVFVAVPAGILLCAAVVLLRRFRPIDVLALAGIALVLYMACRYVRLTIYLQLAAALAAAVMLEHVTSSLAVSRRRLAVAAAAFCLAVAPSVAGKLVPPAGDAAGSSQATAPRCDPRAIAPDLTPLAGRVVLSPVNAAPALIYFSPIIAVAGPYHRAERRILDVLDAYAETAFADGPPDSFRRTGAAAVLVCTTEGHAAGSLGDALARGQAPSWLVEMPASAASRYRLYAVR